MSAKKKPKDPDFPMKTWKGKCEMCEWKFVVICNYPGKPDTCPICGGDVRYVPSRR